MFSALQNKNIKTNILRTQAYDSIMCGYFCIGFIDFMLAGKKLTDYTNLFFPYDFKNEDNMNEWNINEISKINLSKKTKFRLSEIIRIENYFYQEINQRESYSKKLNKYVTAYDYINKVLIVLSATSGGVSIISFTSIIGAPIGITSASFTLVFSLTTGIAKKLLNVTRKKRKNATKFLCWLKLN